MLQRDTFHLLITIFGTLSWHLRLPRLDLQAPLAEQASHLSLRWVVSLAITQQMVDDTKAIKKAYDQWVLEDDCILGAINMKCTATIQKINASVNSARVLWQNLEDQYSVATSAGIFNDFQQATSWKFEDKKDPTQSLNDLLTNCSTSQCHSGAAVATSTLQRMWPWLHLWKRLWLRWKALF